MTCLDFEDYEKQLVAHNLENRKWDLLNYKIN
jgi:hypothetical protein